MTEIEVTNAPNNEEDDKDEEEPSIYSDPNGKFCFVFVFPKFSQFQTNFSPI